MERSICRASYPAAESGKPGLDYWRSVRTGRGAIGVQEQKSAQRNWVRVTVPERICRELEGVKKFSLRQTIITSMRLITLPVLLANSVAHQATGWLKFFGVACSRSEQEEQLRARRLQFVAKFTQSGVSKVDAIAVAAAEFAILTAWACQEHERRSLLF